VAYHEDETIVAIASPPGGAARGIVRLSGPGVLECVAGLFRAGLPENPSLDREEAEPLTTDIRTVNHPTAVAGCLRIAGLHSPLPAELYFWPDARSYTGQPVAELHTLGSPPLLSEVVRAACGFGARLAEPGEFTLRAFLAGRIDLTQAEAVLGVIEATDPRRLDAALEQLAGGLARPLTHLRTALLELLCHLEAGLDFPEEDVSFVTSERIAAQLADARRETAQLRQQLQSRHRAGEHVRVVLVGRPNAGKSSLFNSLTKGTGAIVSHHPGTTRDYLVAELDLDGVRFELIDTAGIVEDIGGPRHPATISTNETGDSFLHQAAEEIARRKSAAADIRIHCLDATELRASEIGRPGHSEAAARNGQGHDLLVLTKVDLIAPSDAQLLGLSVSVVTGQGFDALRSLLRDAVLQSQSPPERAVASTAARCWESLHRAAESLARAVDLAGAGAGDELLAVEIRLALEAIGRVAGAVSTDDVLGEIFGRFCIGK